jgi:anaerobic nitric oxide reductase transcription regulator
VDVRVIAATNRKPVGGGARLGSFRADLYHRLSVYPVHDSAACANAGDDILVLAGHFLELNRARLGLRCLRLSADAQSALRHYHWPGNIRELEHVVSRAALKALSRGASRNDIVTLEAALLDLDALQSPPTAPPTAAAPAPAAPFMPFPPTRPMPLREALDTCQRQAIEAALARHRGQWARAARELEIDPSNLHKLAKRLGMKA